MIVKKNSRIERISPQKNSLHPSYLSQKKSPVDFFGIICGLFENFLGNRSGMLKFRLIYSLDGKHEKFHLIFIYEVADD